MTTTPSTEADLLALADHEKAWTDGDQSPLAHGTDVGGCWACRFMVALISEARAAGRAEALRDAERAILQREHDYNWPAEISDPDQWSESDMAVSAAVVAGVLMDLAVLRESKPEVTEARSFDDPPGAGVEG